MSCSIEAGQECSSLHWPKNAPLQHLPPLFYFSSFVYFSVCLFSCCKPWRAYSASHLPYCLLGGKWFQAEGGYFKCLYLEVMFSHCHMSGDKEVHRHSDFSLILFLFCRWLCYLGIVLFVLILVGGQLDFTNDSMYRFKEYKSLIPWDVFSSSYSAILHLCPGEWEWSVL